MTWLELYQFLHQKANTANPDPNLWQQKVLIHNEETGDEYMCDTLEIPLENHTRLVLSINYND